LFSGWINNFCLQPWTIHESQLSWTNNHDNTVRRIYENIDKANANQQWLQELPQDFVAGAYEWHPITTQDS